MNTSHTTILTIIVKNKEQSGYLRNTHAFCFTAVTTSSGDNTLRRPDILTRSRPPQLELPLLR